MRCVLIHNPAAGGDRSHRLAVVSRAVEVFEASGHQVEVVSTREPGSASGQTREAIASGADVIFACGGDGTVHEVMQGLVSETGEGKASLGILPLGSANALARHLGLSLDPIQAAGQLTRGTMRTISVGKVEYGTQVRYFSVMAGAGPDGALVYGLRTADKVRLGRFAYYLQALRLFLTHSFPTFEVSYSAPGANDHTTVRAVCAMVVRVSDLGGLFRGLAGRDGAVHESNLRLLIVRPPAILSLPMWFVTGWLGLGSLNPLLSFVRVQSCCCSAASGTDVHVEADGEWLGRLPARISVVPDALRLLMPR